MRKFPHTFLVVYRVTSPSLQTTFVAGTKLFHCVPKVIVLHCSIVLLNVMFVREVQLEKAFSPMVVMLSGMAMLLRERQ